MTLFHLWNLPGDVLAAPESASGLDRCNLSLSLSWNALASSQGFHKRVALDAVFLALHRGASNWVSGLCHALSLVGYNLQ